MTHYLLSCFAGSRCAPQATFPAIITWDGTVWALGTGVHKVGTLNFGWLIDGEIAGHSAPQSEADLYYLNNKGIKALVRMAESHKARVKTAQVAKLGFSDCHEPVPDFNAPNQVQIERMITFISQSVAEGKPVGVSCGADIGRTGTILACYLVSKCYTAEQAIQEVKHKRGAEIETDAQKEAVRVFAKKLGKP